MNSMPSTDAGPLPQAMPRADRLRPSISEDDRNKPREKRPLTYLELQA